VPESDASSRCQLKEPGAQLPTGDGLPRLAFRDGACRDSAGETKQATRKRQQKQHRQLEQA